MPQKHRGELSRSKILPALAAAVLLAAGWGSARKAEGRPPGDRGFSSRQSSPSRFPGLSLTAEEEAWLRDHPVIRVVQDPGWAPIEFADERGEPAGISEDYLRLVERRLNLRFERVRGLSWQEAYARLKSRDLDMTTSITATPERGEYFAFTKPYLQSPLIILTRMEVPYLADMRELAGKKVAVVDGYGASEWMPLRFPEIPLVKVRNVMEGLDLLRKEKVFAFVENMLVAGYHVTKRKLVDLKIAGESPFVNAQSMAVRKDWAILAGILQKALDSISEAEAAAIYQAWVPLRYEYGFNARRLWAPLAGFALILAGLVAWNRVLAREVKKRQAAEAAQRLANERLRRFVDSNIVGVVVAAPAGAVLEANDYYLNMLAYTREELHAGLVDWRAITPPEWLPADELAVRELRERGTCAPYEKEYFRRDGSRVSVFLSIARLPGPEEQIAAFVLDIAERKKAEKQLRASRERLAKVFASVPEALVVSRLADGRILDVNDSWTALMGYGREETVGRTSLELGVFADPADRDRAIAAAGARHSLRDFEFRIRRKEGEFRDAVLSTDFLEVGGEPLLLTVLQDVTERKEADRALRESEAKLRLFIEHAPVALAMFDRDMRYLAASRRWMSDYGLGGRDITGRSHYEIFPEVGEDLKAIHRRGLAGEVMGADDARFERTDGTVQYLRWAMLPWRDGDGGVGGIVIFSEDVTARKLAELAWRESEARFRGLIENAPEAIFVQSEGRFRYLNPAMVRFLGASRPEDQLGAELMARIAPEFRAVVLGRIQEQRETGSPAPLMDMEYLRLDGTRVSVETTAVPIRYEGRDAHLVFVRDITERKRAEEALRGSLREKETLLREIHHRVKNNMQVISSLLNLQAGHIGDENAVRMIRESQTRIRSMALIHEKLYQSPDLSTIDFSSYLKNLAGYLIQFFRPEPERIRLEIDMQDVRLDINSAVPCGLLVNELVSNALKHAFPDGRRGVVRLGLERRPDGRVELRIADDGVGFPPDLDFQRASSFGLQIVGLLVAQLEGTIALERRNGTAFTIAFRELDYKKRI